MRQLRITPKDWKGDGVVVIVLGTLLLGSMWVPWASDRTSPKQNFNWTLVQSHEIKFILFTPWGPPVLAVGVVAVLLGILMLVLGPRRRIAQVFALILTAGSLVVLADVRAAMHELYAWEYAAGTGILGAIVVAIVLPIVALAVALTGRLLHERPEPAALAAPPGPATLPPPGPDG
jgi:hypothetical protein